MNTYIQALTNNKAHYMYSEEENALSVMRVNTAGY